MKRPKINVSKRHFFFIRVEIFQPVAKEVLNRYVHWLFDLWPYGYLARFCHFFLSHLRRTLVTPARSSLLKDVLQWTFLALKPLTKKKKRSLIARKWRRLRRPSENDRSRFARPYYCHFYPPRKQFQLAPFSKERRSRNNFVLRDEPVVFAPAIWTPFVLGPDRWKQIRFKHPLIVMVSIKNKLLKIPVTLSTCCVGTKSFEMLEKQRSSRNAITPPWLAQNMNISWHILVIS